MGATGILIAQYSENEGGNSKVFTLQTSILIKYFLELKLTEKTDRKKFTILSCMIEKCKLMCILLIIGCN